jgi:EVE domain
MNANWIAVASAEHVRRGRVAGFMQVCHGKGAPLRRVQPGDGIVYYSPTEVFGGNDGLRAFTAIGRVRDTEPYQFDMGNGFRPFRRDVDWAEAAETPIRPLLALLEFTAGKPNWGYQLRFGLIEVGAHDFAVIAEAMGATISGFRRASASVPCRQGPP